MQKNGPFWRVFENLKLAVKQCYQTLDRSVLVGQKLVENAKIQKFKCDILRNFQTMWIHGSLTCVRFVAHNVIYVVVSENTPYSNISGILQDRPKMQFGSLVIGNVVSRWYVKCKHPLSISLSRHVVIHLGREAKKEGEQSIIL